MDIVLIIGVILLIAAFILWIFSDEDDISIPAIIWVVGTVLILVVAVNTVDNDEGIKADVPEEYWNGSIENLEVYRRTPDSVYLRFRDTAYNK